MQTHLGARSILVAILAALLGLHTTSPMTHAEHTVLAFPAPAGTAWSIVAGYNTATHAGIDPYAVDLVRTDAPTVGTAVLAPLSGIVTWRSDACLTIGDSHEMETLLCHLFPAPGLGPGTPVVAGQYLGELAPAGLAENGGLAHLHFAVHHTLGTGQIQGSIPLAGEYALEGKDLPAVDATNAYLGVTFISSNRETEGGDDLAAPSGEVDSAAGPDEALPSPASASEPVFLHPGWNVVGWTESTPVDEAMAPIADNIDAVFTYDSGAQTFRRYAPGAPAALNSLQTLRPGDGLLIHVVGPGGVAWTRPGVGAPLDLALRPGFNLVTWTGPSQGVVTAVTSVADALVAVHAFDETRQRYRTYRPDAPSFVNELEALETGQAVWLDLRAATSWTPAVVQPQAIVQARVLGPGCLNIRPAPTTVDAPPIGCLAEGTVVELSGQTALDANGDEWLYVRASGYSGWVFAAFIAEFAAGVIVDGTATFLHPSLQGDSMFCGGTYDRHDPTIAAATSFPCGTPLRLWRGDRFVDVIVQDSGQLPPNHIDLSEAAFERIGDLGEGVLAIRIELLARPEDR